MNRTNFFKAILWVFLVFSSSSHLFSAGVFAYVTNAQDNTVSVIDTSTDTVIGLPIPVGNFPTDIAASPDGNFVYVPMYSEDSIYAISTATNMPESIVSIPASSKPIGIAVAPNGFIYCTNFSNATLFIVNPNSMTRVADFTVGSIFPIDVAITPDGTKAYVVNAVGPKNVKVVDLSTNKIIATITASQQSIGVAIHPTLARAYVTNPLAASVTVIDTATNTVIGLPIPFAAGSAPRGITVRPDGLFAYVALQGTSEVKVIDTGTNTVSATVTLTAGSDPYNLAATPDSSKVYVTQTTKDTVSVIDTATNTVIGVPIPVGSFPFSIDIANVP